MLQLQSVFSRFAIGSFLYHFEKVLKFNLNYIFEYIVKWEIGRRIWSIFFPPLFVILRRDVVTPHLRITSYQTFLSWASCSALGKYCFVNILIDLIEAFNASEIGDIDILHIIIKILFMSSIIFHFVKRFSWPWEKKLKICNNYEIIKRLCQRARAALCWCRNSTRGM